ncbi:DeoR/GlpR family DNA-binding transcription regulator [Pseudalkalibacillus salsuginis]|uniref:DeoR/GlpR family DNA-binding transcription regulator n=1 Tax=Pseudalkalibacillus salsuginis TaxID=2910972 RepID=UPI001F2D1CCE|nr:DeoR/GlpR family DNA-binding transcription regulator [Pseudalkalibacillus salsuginis]MCF6411388.1 DeoR/GlpR family DNA-binding transcription regulator [Pseudalkalibacillus salsuginis]
MLVAERHSKIVQIVNEKKSVRVAELSRIFSVTEETIRRDLERLEKEHKLSRSHGGAVSLTNGSDTPETPYFEREIMNVKEKKEIAEEAVKQVEEGDKIILDASSTAWYMAKRLPDIQLTVLTNSIKVALELSGKKQITVFSTGGIMLPRSLSYVGPLAESSFDNYHVNKAFLSCKGFHFTKGLSESNEQQARIKKKMMDIADSVYMMIDHTKFGVQAFTNIGKVDSVDHILTDSNVDQETITRLKQHNLNVIKI